jgi:hypothetical protein
MGHSTERDAGRIGWQQPPIPRRRASTCPHIFLPFASIAAAAHAEGHEWVCGCGQVFVVVSNGGHDKRLVKDWRDRLAPPAEPGADHAGGEQ